MPIPATFFAESLTIISGPGATQLLDAMIAITNTDVYGHEYPKLRFKVLDPETGKPVGVLVECKETFTRMNGYYAMSGTQRAGRYLDRSIIMKYRLSDPDGQGLGIIAGQPLFWSAA